MEPSSRPPGPFDSGKGSRAWDVLFLVACVAVAFWDLLGRSLLHGDVTRFGVVALVLLVSTGVP